MSRPRSATSHRKVIAAALALVSERGVDGASMDAIAEASRVSKATIYKHWKDKDALLLEMMAEIAGVRARPAFNSGNTRADIVAVLAYQPKDNAELKDRLMPHLMAYSARNPSFGRAWRQTVMEPPRQELRHLLQLGIERGQLWPKLDLELSLALLLGPLVYWHVFRRNGNGAPVDKNTTPPAKATPARSGRFAWVSPSAVVVRRLAESVVDAFWRAYGIQSEAAASRTSLVTRARKPGVSTAAN
jgi:AcrR family transcriptional regulator